MTPRTLCFAALFSASLSACTYDVQLLNREATAARDAAALEDTVDAGTDADPHGRPDDPGKMGMLVSEDAQARHDDAAADPDHHAPDAQP